MVFTYLEGSAITAAVCAAKAILDHVGFREPLPAVSGVIFTIGSCGFSARVGFFDQSFYYADVYFSGIIPEGSTKTSWMPVGTEVNWRNARVVVHIDGEVVFQ